MSLKRSASSSPMRLISRPSPHNSAVTLFESANLSTFTDSDYTVSPRRSKRVKRTVSVKTEAEETLPAVDDESIVSTTPKVSSVLKSQSRKAEVVKLKAESSSPKKLKRIQMELDVPHPAPPHWEEEYNAMREMRKMYVAPVDTMGCDTAQRREQDPKSGRLSTLISLMLSSQTKDEVTDAATAKLREALGGSITVEGLINVEESTISEAIQKVGFWRRKTGYIKQAAMRLREDFGSDVPKTIDELCSLPGVGPKMAFLCLQSAWKINVGIGVDVHVHRITNRLHWHEPPTKTPEETRLNLQSWLPKELHPEINHLLVGFGQTVCLPVGPRCDVCSLSQGLCPSAQTSKVSKNRKALILRTESIINKVKEEEIQF